MPLLGYSGQIY